MGSLAYRLSVQGLAAPAVPAPGVDGIVPPRSVPNDDVVRVEGPVSQWRNDDGFLLDHAPAQAVGGDQTVQQGDVPARGQGGSLVGDGLVAFLRVCFGIPVLDHGDGPALAPRHGPHQVVLLRSVVLDEAQFGLHPMDPVQALGIGGVDGFLHGPGPVPHPVSVSVLDDHRVVDGVVLPGTIPPQDDLPRLRTVQDVTHVVQALDQPVVPERLELASYVPHLRGSRDAHRKQPAEEQTGRHPASAWR